MSRKLKVETAVSAARRLAAETGELGPPLRRLTRLAKIFSALEFEVPDLPDADGYLFQYGKVNWFPDPTFTLSIARQLEVVDASGEHESYLQVQFEFRYPVDVDLDSVSSHSEWWFPGGGVSFNDWLESLARAPIGEILGSRESREFEVWQEYV